MFLAKLECYNCKKEIDDNEDIMIAINNKDLKGITNVKQWAKNQKVYCSQCSKK
ncbi:MULTISPECIES: hypothetical protein [Staphylococcus]|uniref:Uncharacterized protein n=1 Tax=Staphylococcus hsinchuensis TaxID=3051183 RepID=A0ABZ3EEN4_9STAP|nr:MULTISPECIES: hypothetical protein [unclassified Staphylococcus]